jgi:hypothetical protein
MKAERKMYASKLFELCRVQTALMYSLYATDQVLFVLFLNCFGVTRLIDCTIMLS